jgi:UDP-2,3-diacylglucosamine hydrolase
MPQKAIFVSDLHLVGPNDPKTKLFAKFLRALREEKVAPVTHLFLVGDIFDLWVGDHDYFSDRFANVVTEIRALVQSGVEVHYFEGNHDLHLEKFWADQLHVDVHTDDATFTLAGQIVRIEHGDQINPDDHGYLFLRALLRSAPVTFLAHALPERFVKLIGERASTASRDYTSNAKGKPQDEIRQLIRQHAEAQSHLTDFDLIITGHVHVADDFTFDVGGKKVRSINLGSWFESPPRALVLDSRGLRFEEIKS